MGDFWAGLKIHFGGVSLENVWGFSEEFLGIF